MIGLDACVTRASASPSGARNKQMTDIYANHAKAFAGVSAYVVTNKKGELVARVAFKFAKSGLRTTCYFHVIGFPMTKAQANGGGYDKASAAMHQAVSRLVWQGGETIEEQHRYDQTLKLVSAITDTGASWDADLREAGFVVLQAV